MLKYAVLILTHNRIDDVKACLESLMLSTDKPNTYVVILDNASTDGTQHYLSGIESGQDDVSNPWLILDSPTNLGVAGGRAELLKHVGSAQYVVFLDSDTVIADDAWLDKLGAFLDENERYGAVGEGASMVLPDWSGFIAGTPGQDCDCLAGYLIMFRSELLSHGLHMDMEAYAKFWCEDSDFCLQIREMGFDIYAMFAGVLHNPAHSGFGQDAALHEAHFATFRQRWQGKGLVKAEGAY